jgi:hypothetical protein
MPGFYLSGKLLTPQLRFNNGWDFFHYTELALSPQTGFGMSINSQLRANFSAKCPANAWIPYFSVS